jgi:hypothetical protein
MTLGVEQVSAVLRPLPCIQIEVLLRRGQVLEGIQEESERSGGQAIGLHEESGDAGRGDLEAEWVL